jgi:hypothetical protein
MNQMLNKIYSTHIRVQLRIVILFGIIFAFSFVPDLNREFFGDWLCGGGKYQFVENGPDIIEGCQYPKHNNHGPTWHWGFRHWIWMLTGLTLFIYNAVSLISSMSENSKNC